MVAKSPAVKALATPAASMSTPAIWRKVSSR
jgi:hypothetical protein